MQVIVPPGPMPQAAIRELARLALERATEAPPEAEPLGEILPGVVREIGERGKFNIMLNPESPNLGNLPEAEEGG